MPTNDGFSSDQTLPSFLRERTWKPEIGKASDLAVFPPRALKAAILITSAIVLGIATFSVGNPLGLLANLPASSGDKSALQPVAPQSTSIIQTSADAQATSSTTKEQSAGGEIAVTETAGEDQAKTIDAQTEALFRQFLAWAAEKDAQALEPVQPVQDAPVQSAEEAVSQPAQDDPPAKVADEARAPLRKHRRAATTSNARAELPKQAPRTMVHRPQRERVAPPRAALVRNQLVQNADPRSLPPGFFGSRD
jgi:hypothetical protein